MDVLREQCMLQVNSMYEKYASLCADSQNSKQTTLLPTEVFMPLSNVLTGINQWNEDARDVAKNLSDIIPLNFRRDILLCYSKMQIHKQVVATNQIGSSINSIAACMQDPIIVSCWNNLNQIATENENIVNSQGIWAINNIKIDSLDIPMLPSLFCNSFLVIEKEDAPYIDFEKKNIIFIPKEFTLVGDNKESCHLGRGFMKTNGNECAVLLNTCNLFYNPNATIHQVVVKPEN